MAKKSKTSKQVLRERSKLEWILFILLLIIGYLLLASHYLWWPSHKVYDNLGTAFYAGIPQTDADNSGGMGTAATAGSGGTGATGTTGSGGNAGGTGNTGNTGGGGSTPGGGGGGSTSSDSALLTFASGVNTGNSKQEVDGRANGLNKNCAVVVNASTVGKQEVCTYTQGDKVITVTYLNDRVVSASRSGF